MYFHAFYFCTYCTTCGISRHVLIIKFLIIFLKHKWIKNFLVRYPTGSSHLNDSIVACWCIRKTTCSCAGVTGDCLLHANILLPECSAVLRGELPPFMASGSSFILSAKIVGYNCFVSVYLWRAHVFSASCIKYCTGIPL